MFTGITVVADGIKRVRYSKRHTRGVASSLILAISLSVSESWKMTMRGFK